MNDFDSAASLISSFGSVLESYARFLFLSNESVVEQLWYEAVIPFKTAHTLRRSMIN